MYPATYRLKQCRKIHQDGALHISPEHTVAEMETELWEKFGLSVQIFRKSGNLWIETSLTDSWTLERQNREGMEMSEKYRNPYKEAEDENISDRDKWE